MTDDSDNLVDGAVWDLARAVEEGLEDHPAPETLLKHHRGQLPPEEAAVVEDHLLWCRDCMSFSRHAPVPEEELGPVDPGRASAEWERLRRRLESESVLEAGADPSDRGRVAGPTARPLGQHSLARAAGVAVALLGVGIWIGYGLWSEEETAVVPQPNVQIVDLAPRASGREGASPPTELSAGTYTVLVLSTRLPDESGRYDVRFIDSGGSTAFTVRDLVPAEFGNLHIGVPPGAIAPGTYRLELLEAGAARPFGTFEVRVLEPPA